MAIEEKILYPDLTDKDTAIFKAVKDVLLFYGTLEIIQEFKRKNIDFLVLKGLYLAFAIYPDIGARPMVDVDFLIKRVDLNRIDEILRGLGYVDISPQGQRIYGCDLTYSNKYGVYIDIHWDLCQYERFKGIIDVTDDFWKRACEFSLDGIPLRTLSLEDHILYVSLHHGLVHLLAGINVSRDLFYLINDRPIKWKAIIDNAHKYGIKIPLYYTLHKASRMTTLKLPDFVWRSLKPAGLKKPLLDWLLSKPRPKILCYLSQALMMGRGIDTFKVLWRILKGISRVYRRSCHTPRKNMPGITKHRKIGAFLKCFL